MKTETWWCSAARRGRRSARDTGKLLLLVMTILFWVSPIAAAGTPSLTVTQQVWLTKANRHEKSGWVYLHIEGSPEGRGFQHGYVMAREINDGIRATRIDWEFKTATEWSWLVKKAAALFVKRIDKENLAELDGIVEGMQAAGVPSTRAEIIAYNAYIELSGYWWPEELKKIKDGNVKFEKQSCSAFIATGQMTADGGVVLAHSTWGPYYDPLPNLILDIVPENGHRILMQTWPGWIHSGTDFFITDAGLVGTETTISWYSGFDSKGIPEFSRMRRATQDADSIGDWCAIMKNGNNGGYANSWLLGDVKTGEIARLELGLKYIGYERKRDGYFTGSNIAEDPKILRFETEGHDTDIRGGIVARRVRWEQLMTQHVGKVDVDLAKAFEADHFDTYFGQDHPCRRSLCGHLEMDHEPADPWSIPNEPAGAYDAKVVDASMARGMKFAARWGAPCGAAFDAEKFLKENPQFKWMSDILHSRPSQPWTEFVSGEKQ